MASQGRNTRHVNLGLPLPYPWCRRNYRPDARPRRLKIPRGGAKGRVRSVREEAVWRPRRDTEFCSEPHLRRRKCRCFRFASLPRNGSMEPDRAHEVGAGRRKMALGARNSSPDIAPHCSSCLDRPSKSLGSKSRAGWAKTDRYELPFDQKPEVGRAPGIRREFSPSQIGRRRYHRLADPGIRSQRRRGPNGYDRVIS